MTTILWRSIDVLSASLGITLLLSVVWATVQGGVKLVRSSVSVHILLVTARALLIAMAWLRLALSEKTDQSLVAPGH